MLDLIMIFFFIFFVLIFGFVFLKLVSGEVDFSGVIKGVKSVNISGAKMFGVGCFLCVLAAVALLGGPVYNVWQQNKVGEAELARAEQNRQIAIQEARAKEESAKSLANAEVIRAEGVAKANEIIGNSLKDNDAYIHYLWIEALRESKSDVIYVPTEAGIPITESGRFHQIKERQSK